MRTILLKPGQRLVPLIFFLLIALSSEAFATDNKHNHEVRFNSEFKVNKSDEQVDLFMPAANGDTMHCIIQGFNAAALWCIYQNMSWQKSVEYLSETYEISKTESRRKFKHTVYTLERYGVVTQIENLAFSTNE